MQSIATRSCGTWDSFKAYFLLFKKKNLSVLIWKVKYHSNKISSTLNLDVKRERAVAPIHMLCFQYFQGTMQGTALRSFKTKQWTLTLRVAIFFKFIYSFYIPILPPPSSQHLLSQVFPFPLCPPPLRRGEPPWVSIHTHNYQTRHRGWQYF